VDGSAKLQKLAEPTQQPEGLFALASIDPVAFRGSITMRSPGEKFVNGRPSPLARVGGSQQQGAPVYEKFGRHDIGIGAPYKLNL
jgi:hypothetical protein